MDDLTALIEFRDARLAEDEAAAEKPVEFDYAYADHARREIEFKRWILAEHAPVPFWGNNPPPRAQRTPGSAVMHYCECQSRDGVIEGTYPCETVRRIFAIWSEHSDYQQGWKP